MFEKVSKNGKDFAIRIPSELAEEIGLEDGTELDLQVINGVLRMYPPDIPFLTLEDLVAGITPDNRHELIDWGPPVGKEIW